MEGNSDRVTGCVKTLDSTVSAVCVSLTMGSCRSNKTALFKNDHTGATRSLQQKVCVCMPNLVSWRLVVLKCELFFCFVF